MTTVRRLRRWEGAPIEVRACVPTILLAVLVSACSGGGSSGGTEVATCGDDARAVHLATGHLDEDGTEELIVACAPTMASSDDGGSVEVFRSADGTYEPIASHGLAAVPTDVAVGDLSGDGIDDLAVSLAGAHERTLAVLVGDGAAGIATTVEATTEFELGPGVVHDVGGDGSMDVVSPRTNRRFENDGGSQTPGPFSDGAFVDAGQANALDRADADGDGRPDAIHRDAGAEVIQLHLADGAGAQELAVGGLAADIREVLAGGDLDGDGELELLVAMPIDPYDSEVQVLDRADGSWELSAPIEGLAGRRARVLVADLTGDGHLDLLAAPESDPDGDDHHLTLVPGNGDGSFAPAETTALDHFPYRPIVAGAQGGDAAEVLLIGTGDEAQDQPVLRWTGAEDAPG